MNPFAHRSFARFFPKNLSPLFFGTLTLAAIMLVGGTFYARQAFAFTPEAYINEFVSHPSSSGSEWIELYNTTGTAIDFSATPWKIQNRTFTGSTPTGTATTTISSGTLPAHGFLAVSVSGLNDSGDIITLYNDAGVFQDEVVYGTVTGSAEEVDAPGIDESAYRTTDGGSTWALTSSPTKGITNVPATTPACSGTSTFDAFNLGSVNGQGGWTSTGAYDQAVVNNTYGATSFGCKTLRISNAVTSGALGDQTFASPATASAGESAANNHFEASFDIASTMLDEQPGLAISVSPDDGTGNRMSYLRFEDSANGINVFFDDVPGGQSSIGTANEFTETQIAGGSAAIPALSRTSKHTVNFSVDFVPGPSNDVVKVSIDGTLAITGTSWEDYYRYDPEQASHVVPTTDTLLFRAGGAAAPATSGNGFLFDNVSLTSSEVLPAPVLNGENFNTVDDATYTGISVGFDAKNFGVVSAVTVDMTRADGSHVVMQGDQGLFDLLSNQTTATQATAPFVIKEGTYHAATDVDANGHLYWKVPSPSVWDTGTMPTSVTITVTGANGTATVTIPGPLSQGAPSWPAYADMVPPAAPTNTHFIYQGGTLVCGATVNTVYSNSLQFVWDDPASMPHHRTKITYPDGTTKTAYTDSRNVWMSKTNYGDNGFGNATGEMGNGIYTYEVQGENAAGEWSNTAAPCTIALDTKSPTAAFSPVPPTYVNGNFVVSGTAADNVALKGVLFDVRDPHDTTGNSWRAGCVSGTQTTIWGTASTTADTSCTMNTANLTEGYSYTLRIHAGDYAGYGSAGQQQDLILDTTRPNGSITAPATGSIQTGAFTIAGTATDTTSGVDYVLVYVTKLTGTGGFGGYAVRAATSTWDGNTNTFSYAVTGLADGKYTVKADVFDKAGNNHFASASPTITVQNTVPVLTITTPAIDGAYATSTYAFAAQYDNGVTTGLDWAIRSGANATCTGGTTVAGNVDGHHDASTFSGTAFVTSLDTTKWNDGAYCLVVNDGHSNRPVRTFTVDNAAPTVPANGAPNNVTSSTNSFTFTWDASTDASPITYQSQFTLNPAQTGGVLTTGLWASTTPTNAIISRGASDGTWYWQVRAVDAAGNVSAWSPVWQVTLNTSGSSGTGQTVAGVTTNDASEVGNLDAILNGTNGPVAADGHSFWVSTSTINTSSPTIPEGVYSTTDMGTIAASTDFSAALSSLVTSAYVHGQVLGHMPAITPNTTYYYAAWVRANNAWIPGAVKSFTTTAPTESTTTVQAADLATSATDVSKWFFWNDTSSVLDTTDGTFVTGPGTAPAGDGSAEISAPANKEIALATNIFNGVTPLSKITNLQYSTYRTTDDTTRDLSLQFDVAVVVGTSPSATTYTGRLEYDPDRTDTVTKDVWQTWTPTNDAINSGVNNNKGWWFSGGTASNLPSCTAAAPCTWSEVLANYPNTSVSGKAYLIARTIGGSSDAFTGNVDDFSVTTNDGSNVATTAYNFEPTPTQSGGAGGSGTGVGAGSSGSACALATKGDINCDGHIDFLDFALLMGAYGANGVGLKANLNTDTHVDATDLAILVSNWGTSTN